jgi:hypothetical protein
LLVLYILAHTVMCLVASFVLLNFMKLVLGQTRRDLAKNNLGVVTVGLKIIVSLSLPVCNGVLNKRFS